MTIIHQINKAVYGKAAWPFALAILAFLILVEVLPIFFQLGSRVTADWISFIYVTMRFGILPIACIAHVGMILFRIIKPGDEKLKIDQIGSVVVSVGYLLLLYFHPLPLTEWK